MLQITSNNIQSIRDLIQTKSHIVITSHHNPDGDAVGSMLGLYHVLKTIGVEAATIIPNEIPEFLSWLPACNQIVRYSKNRKKADDLLDKAEVIFALDYNCPQRLEAMQDAAIKSNAVKILIDHHPNPDNAFNWLLSEVSASSTAELVYEFALMLTSDNEVNKDAAICLYTGIMTDTGSFSYACSRPRTFEIAAKLIAKGISVEEIQQQVYNNFSESRMRLLGYALDSKMKVFPEYRAAYISLTRNELNRFKYSIGDTEGLVNYPLSIKGITFSALFIENKDFVKISLRSSGNFAANKVSEEYFNGGGHLNAAGGKSFASLHETEEKFVEILMKNQTELKK